MASFALTIFSGAFLLFAVQPLIAKFVVPWFGGSPAVWSTCMLFFQGVLLAAYAYAHLSDRFLSVRAQAILHAVLLACAALTLPIVPDPSWKPVSADAPVSKILGLLAVSVGAPVFALSATGPLLGRWFARVRPGASPYPLFALSNFASLLALAAYPFAIEPALSRSLQATVWAALFVLFGLLCAWCAWKAQRAPAPALVVDANGGEAPPRLTARMLWFLLPACACVLLLASTSQICLDIAAIPFLWVLPLGLYLLSFVLCFESPRWYHRGVWVPVLAIAIGGVCHTLFLSDDRDASVFVQVAVLAGAMFVGCMVCHGELARLKPSPARLTSYYLAIAAGGATGGAFVTLVAPRIFDGYFELHAAWIGCVLLLLAAIFRDELSPLHRGRHPWVWAALLVGAVTLGAILWKHASNFVDDVVEVERDFYGVLEVNEYGSNDPEMTELVLSQGTTLHGLQFTHPAKRRLPTAYYGEESGVGRALRSKSGRGERRIGAVGLGAGTIAALGQAGDRLTFYELDPVVKRFADDRFTFLEDTLARCDFVFGDARLALERQEAQDYDVLILDAFSSDAIPVHLLTREAVGAYLRHLKPDGIMAVHVSNAFVDLDPVVAAAGLHHGLTSVLIDDFRRNAREKPEEQAEDVRLGLYTSEWILLSREKSVLEQWPIGDVAEDLVGSLGHPPLEWTDDSTPLFPILR